MRTHELIAARTVLGAALLLLSVGGPSVAEASVVWRGDFETGDRSQWSHTQMVSADRLQVVSTPAAEGLYALKATVRQGDDPIDSSGNRNELVRMTNEREGQEFYYRWYTLFPADFPAPDTWQLFVQWHHSGSGGSPPVEFVVKDERIELSLDGASWVPWSMPLVRGRWLEFIFHVKWSASRTSGFVELWVDGEQVLPKTAAATLYAGQTNYLKMGLYRNESIAPVGVVFHDGMVQATTLADVWPQQAAPAPGGSTAPAVTPPGPGEDVLDTVDRSPAQEVASLQGCSAAGAGPAGLAGLLALAALLRRRRR